MSETIKPTEVTPSKLVCRHLCHSRLDINTDASRSQAASNLEALKMDSSPAKKIDYDASESQDSLVAVPLVGLPELKKPTVDAVEDAMHSVAPTIKAEEADEPILRENPNRFVLFPIKYNEVRVATRPRRVERSASADTSL